MPTCDSCGANLPDGITCEDDFHQFLYWEFQYPDLWPGHHLMVLCYHIQHPHLYSKEGLRGAHDLLRQFVATDITPQAMRQKIKKQVDSGNRQHKIRGTGTDQGHYPRIIPWPMHARDVVNGGYPHYVENVQAWAQAIYNTLLSEGLLLSV